MKMISTAIPDDLTPHLGEEIQFQALVQKDGTLLVTRVIHRQPVPARTAPKMTLGDWGRKWAGIAALKPEQTVEELKREAYRKRFGN